jgi:HEAT repeat protein
VKDTVTAIFQLVGTEDVEVVRPLIRVCQNVKMHAGVRASAVQALGRIGKGADLAIPVLVAVIQDENDQQLRISAIFALGDIGPTASSAIPLLTKTSGENDSRVAEAARTSLLRIKEKKKR